MGAVIGPPGEATEEPDAVDAPYHGCAGRAGGVLQSLSKSAEATGPRGEVGRGPERGEQGLSGPYISFPCGRRQSPDFESNFGQFWPFSLSSVFANYRNRSDRVGEVLRYARHLA